MPDILTRKNEKYNGNASSRVLQCPKTNRQITVQHCRGCSLHQDDRLIMSQKKMYMVCGYSEIPV